MIGYKLTLIQGWSVNLTFILFHSYISCNLRLHRTRELSIAVVCLGMFTLKIDDPVIDGQLLGMHFWHRFH